MGRIDSSYDNGFTRKSMKAEMLDADTEHALALAWRDNRDEAALHRLISAYMRLAISQASKFKRYGAPMPDLIQEAALGLMKAAEKFDPDRGVRFSTYAVWWIKASVQDHVMRNWSLVRTGSTSAQKSLFFNMRRVQARFEREALAAGAPIENADLMQKIAAELGVPLRDVEAMNGRLSGSDFSLNATQSSDEEGREWIDTLVDDGATTSETVEENHDQAQLKAWVGDAMSKLTDRERYILTARKLADEPRTLESLGDELKLSKERVRQVEVAAFGKMRSTLAGHGEALTELLN
ncbi:MULTISPECIES: RNA polymerase factor sigma-32 [Pacificibacter]|uniref:RNA polymerase factor sigma-32 n=1 Tax=Pacificibacter TaxID=1042323 RepID=UPI001C09AD1F|nr:MULTISPECIES: RNA polymerase factor sigma-32 [Pacificibacter]MBU2937666.1 RNA polymerase factor sigma-32 [Pacificibacter marinus]MDO6616160.1 RNA polymerase factor sigma-32 [Pacificibacter sp. 1_MG-2023]